MPCDAPHVTLRNAEKQFRFSVFFFCARFERDKISSTMKKSWLATLSLLAILWLAFILRFYNLGAKSLWGDEIAQAAWSAWDWARLWARFLGPPDLILQFALVHLSQTLGATEFWVRLPSAATSFLAVPVTFVVARRLTERNTALVATLFMAVAPYQIWYAQDARMYAPHTLYALLSLYFFLRLTRRPDWKSALGLLVANMLGIYNHLFGAMPPLIEGVAAVGLLAGWLYQRTRILALNTGAARRVNRRVPRWVAPFVASMVGYVLAALPLLPGTLPLLVRGGSRAPGVEFPFATPFQLTPMFVEELLGFYGLGAGLDWRAWLSAALAALGLAFLLWRKKQSSWIVLCWFVFPLAVLGLTHPQHEVSPRYLIFLQPVYLVLLAQGVMGLGALVFQATQVSSTQGKLDLRRVGALAFGLFILGVVTISPLQALYARAKINDWRAIAGYITSNAEPGDLVVGETGTWATGALGYYIEDASAYSTPRVKLSDLQAAVAQNRRLWYVSLGGIFDAEIEAWARENLNPIPDKEWQHPELLYQAAGNFVFPQSESPAHIYFFGDALASEIVYHDRGAGRQGKSHIAVRPSDTLRAKLQPPPSETASSVTFEIEFKSEAPAQFEVLLNGQWLAQVQEQAAQGDWQTLNWTLPSDLAATVVLEVRNTSQALLLVHSLRLK